jgi:hypothetical protein
MLRAPLEDAMTDPIDLDRTLFIESFIELVYETAGVCQMDAHMLRESGQDARVWEIAHEELRKAADRIKRRTAGLPSVQRCEPPDELVAIDPSPRAEKATASRPQLRLVSRESS